MGCRFAFRRAHRRDDLRFGDHRLFGFPAALFGHPNQSVHDQAYRRDRSVHAALLRRPGARAAGPRSVSQYFLFCRRQRVIGDLARWFDRVGRGSYRQSAALVGLLYRVCFVRHAFHFLHHRLAVAARQGGTGQLLAQSAARSDRAGHQRLFPVRHDFDRIAALVAVCLSHARGGVSFDGPVA